MAVCVIANFMSRSGNSAGNFRTLPYIFADQKKRRFSFMSGQHVKQVERVRIVGPIIISKRNLAGITTVGERAPIELRFRSHGGVSGIAGGGSRGKRNKG